MKILSIDSSSVSASAAVTENGRIFAEEFVNNGYTHSVTLMPIIEKVLKNSKSYVSDIDLLAITNGPGSFTGVRIGIASAKGICDAANIPCFAVSTLEAIAKPLSTKNVLAVSVMDARCNQVYTASFYMGKREKEDRAILISELLNELKNEKRDIVFIGDGALMCYDMLKSELGNISVADEEIRLVHASNIALLAEEKIANGESTVKSEDLLPFYLRLPQAERELRAKKA
ncbi:MAG: tRNA (adenosine(37)-N6)-threonylcarbamoyltransferase complex dimerization subunit type 1 TsaB [Oscillospiraceae bacterium]|nr:tRNA (adenosine(37)-N6)-threonylcarbamoyltransferase complex dimerization subunit type 1 TsaB [Oscillospiraceae bacterium]